MTEVRRYRCDVCMKVHERITAALACEASHTESMARQDPVATVNVSAQEKSS